MDMIRQSLRSDEREVIATLSQCGSQYDAPTLALWRLLGGNAAELPAGTIVLHSNDGADSYDYRLTNDETAKVLADTNQYLQTLAEDLASEADDPMIESILWGCRTHADWAVPEDYTGACRVIQQSYYYGHTPVDYLRDDSTREIIVFASPAEAQAMIDDASSGVYRLSHNEAARPSYTIVNAYDANPIGRSKENKDR